MDTKTKNNTHIMTKLSHPSLYLKSKINNTHLFNLFGIGINNLPFMNYYIRNAVGKRNILPLLKVHWVSIKLYCLSIWIWSTGDFFKKWPGL